MTDYILAIDQGTTGTTALLVDHDLNVTGRQTIDFPQHYPRPGWVEHDAEEVWLSVRRAVIRLREATGIAARQIAAIGLTNQRETTLLWERRTGRPIGHAIVWQCRRSAPICEELKAAGEEEAVRAKTGLVLDPYFSASKLTWMFREDAGVRQRAAAGELAFGTVDSFLVWRLTGGRRHLTDVANASRTLLLDIHRRQWDDDLCRLFAVPAAILPEVRGSSETYGATAGLDFLPDGIPVAGMAGDQQAALFGQACFAPGQSKCTYGTGAFILENIGTCPLPSRHGLLTTVAWQIGDQAVYAFEGSSFIAGAAVQWLRDGLGLLRSAAEIESLAASVPDSGGIVFVPALAGLGAPHWRSDARGLISGLTRGTTAAHLARATLEGIALQIHDLVMAMGEDRGEPLSLLKVDGGAAANNLLMQLQADLLDRPVSRPATVETTALGAAMLAGLAVGFWSDLAQLSASWREERCFRPAAAPAWREELLTRWQTAIGRA
ncbi:MAG: glycerol kinase GlpK [Desulfuromonadales bacterium]|nr:glycerol kinase GlpK [Desulfuromonadales bacterium]